MLDFGKLYLHLLGTLKDITTLLVILSYLETIKHTSKLATMEHFFEHRKEHQSSIQQSLENILSPPKHAPPKYQRLSLNGCVFTPPGSTSPSYKTSPPTILSMGYHPANLDKVPATSPILSGGNPSIPLVLQVLSILLLKI